MKFSQNIFVTFGPNMCVIADWTFVEFRCSRIFKNMKLTFILKKMNANQCYKMLYSRFKSENFILECVTFYCYLCTSTLVSKKSFLSIDFSK